ncbi:MAG: PilW family protein [Candidatus Dactylopiibacterium sp.]|nr:PilW family protein [Candidatus Dactylopiibacterium sp.]
MRRHSYRTAQHGLTLIELMVALVVGMLVTLAATSGASFFESMRRSAVGSSSALENGIAVSFDVQRRVQSAGLWTANGPCAKIWRYNYTSSAWESNADVSAAGTLGAPVEITAASSEPTSSDAVTTRTTTRLVSAPTTLTAASDGGSLTVSDATGFQAGHMVLVRPPANDSSECYLASITAVSGSQLSVTPVVSGAAVTTSPAYPAAYPIASQVFNFGNVENTLLRVTNTAGTKALDVFESVDLRADPDGDPDRNGTTTVLAENVVLVRAQYGVSSAATSLAIERWVNPGSAEATSNRLRAIRMAVVARSQQPNLKNKDANDACTTTAASPDIPWTINSNDDTPRALDLDLTAQPERRCYEYRLTNIVIPLKNYMFSGGGA